MFTKLGSSAYLSHLDLIRALPRAFRRAGLPLFYTSGYHPKADMTFSPALSLGVMSLGEVVDVKLTCSGDASAWLEALSAGAPDGLRFTMGRALGPGDAAVSKLIDTAQYALAIPRSVMTEADMHARGAAAMSAETLPLVRVIDGIGKKVDVRKFLRKVAVGDARAEKALVDAGLVGDLAPVFVEIAVTPSGSAKISEAADAIFGKDVPVKAVRAALLGSERSPLELLSSSPDGESREAPRA